jgi:hypothetical protein
LFLILIDAKIVTLLRAAEKINNLRPLK